MSRTNNFINDIMVREGMQPWDVLVRREIFRWAGWTARLQDFDTSRITLKILKHKNWEWLQTIARNNKGRQLHGRCLRVWRWEALIYNFFRENHQDANWFLAALDQEGWNRIVQSVF